MKFLSAKFGFTPPEKGPKWGKTLQIGRKSSKLTLLRGGGGETGFYGQNDFMDIWAFLILKTLAICAPKYPPAAKAVRRLAKNVTNNVTEASENRPKSDQKYKKWLTSLCGTLTKCPCNLNCASKSRNSRFAVQQSDAAKLRRAAIWVCIPNSLAIRDWRSCPSKLSTKCNTWIFQRPLRRPFPKGPFVLMIRRVNSLLELNSLPR